MDLGADRPPQSLVIMVIGLAILAMAFFDRSASRAMTAVLGLFTLGLGLVMLLTDSVAVTWGFIGVGALATTWAELRYLVRDWRDHPERYRWGKAMVVALLMNPVIFFGGYLIGYRRYHVEFFEVLWLPGVLFTVYGLGAWLTVRHLKRSERIRGRA